MQRSPALRGAALGALLLLAALAMDGRRPPDQQLGVRLGLGVIGVYQATASRWLGAMGVRCRFRPSCSRYGEAAIAHRGLVPGAWLAIRRVAKCGPWTPAGTVDPAPGKEPANHGIHS